MFRIPGRFGGSYTMPKGHIPLPRRRRTMRAISEITELRGSKAHQDAGIITFTYGLNDQSGEVAGRCLWMTLIKKYSA
jgi:hypothetical protein